jgi:MoxR-like ATPase
MLTDENMSDDLLPPPVGRDREFELLVACLKAGRNLLIEGPVGVGKTRLAQEGARVLNRPMIRVDGDECASLVLQSRE